MPFYDYQADSPDFSCDHCAESFEVLQGINDERLKACPECGSPVHRLLSTFLFHESSAPTLSQGNLEKHGFTQYTKSEKGVYEKTAGKGPRIIKDGKK